MMGGFRRMIPVVKTTGIGSILRAVAGRLRRRDAVRWRWATTVRLLHLLTLLIIAWGFWAHMVTVFPLPMSLGRCRRGTIFSIASSSFSCRKSRSGRRGTTGDTASGRRIRVVLVRALIPVAGRPRAVLDDWPNLGRWTTHTPIGWKRALGLARWTVQSAWGRWRGRRHAVGVRSIIGVRNTAGLLRLWLLVRRELRLSLRSLRRKLRWRRMIWAWSDVMGLWGWRKPTSQRPRWRRAGGSRGS
jgi:hypothetical protein